MNRMKTLFLLAVLTAALLGLGQWLGGRGGLMIALLLSGVMSFGAYWFSDSIVLRMHGAKEIDESQAPGLFAMVRDLAQRAGIPMPRVYVIPEEAPNAFATGRSPEKGAVAVTEGILRILDREELAGVVAHELGHVKNRDTLVMTVAGTLAGAISHLASMGMWGLFGRSDDEEGPNPLALILGVVLAPIAASLVQMAISRSREFLADEAGASISGNPLALAGALRKLESWKADVPMHAASPATAHLFIVNPFTGGGLASLFSTHPLTAERIARLEAMAMGGVRPS